jgi:hypothetical protein
MPGRARAFALVLCLQLLHARAECDLAQAVGYTLIRATTIDGEFKGCQFGATVRLASGSTFTCASVWADYSISPRAYVFAKREVMGGVLPDAASVKLCVDGHLYDMQPVLLEPLTSGSN